MIKQNIQHLQQERVGEPSIQATITTVPESELGEINIAGIYCPPRYTPSQTQFTDLFTKLSTKFFIGGDCNFKHTACDSRLLFPGEKKILLIAINISKCEYHHARELTYQPTETNKISDIPDFFISKGIISNQVTAENICDLMSDHSSVLLTLSPSVV